MPRAGRPFAAATSSQHVEVHAMGLIQEFKTFALKGNVVDMAVGIVIGAAFTKIVNSLVGDILMPPLGAIAGGDSFADKFLWLGGEMPEGVPTTVEAAKASGRAFIAWGQFVQVVIEFLIVAFALFIVVKLMNQARDYFDGDKQAPPPPETPEDIKLLRDIRDSLQARKA
jgi:large conductance mechanosensitive channel